MEYDEDESRRTERAYLSPEVVYQRARTLEIVNPELGENIVDVGCGPGMLTKMLADTVGPKGTVVGIDSSVPMIGLARQRCKNMDNVSFAEANIGKLPFASESVDVVTCMQVLLYVSDVSQALNEMRRILVPGGSVHIMETDWRSAVVHSSDSDLAEKIISAWDAAVPSSQLPARLAPLCREAGFDAVNIEAIPLISTDANPDGFSMSALTQCVADAVELDRISEAQGAAWLSELSDLSADDRFFFCVNRFLFSMQKPLA